jgi:hypothetical protein
VRLDVKFNDTFSAWIMGGYQSGFGGVGINADGDLAVKRSFFGTWFGDYADWAGVSAKASDKATVHAQLAYEDGGRYAAALNIGYELVPGFKITPEVSCTHFGDDFVVQNKDAFEGILRFQRNF